MTKATPKALVQGEDFEERKTRAENKIQELLQSEGLALLATLKYGDLEIKPSLLFLDVREIEKNKKEEEAVETAPKLIAPPKDEKSK